MFTKIKQAWHRKRAIKKIWERIDGERNEAFKKMLAHRK